MEWLIEFLGELISPAWVAGVISGLLSTALAFLGAILLFNRQLRHDRQLAAAELAQAVDDRKAERRADAAAILGAEIDQVKQFYATKSPEQLMALLREDPNRRAPGTGELWTAWNRAALVIDDLPRTNRVWSELTNAWDFAQAHVVAAGVQDEYEDWYHLMVPAVGTIMRSTLDFEPTAAAILRWDGRGPLPIPEPEPPFLGIPRRSPEKIWREYRETYAPSMERPSVRSDEYP